MFFREYSIKVLIVYSLIDFALVVLNLLMFKVCEIIGTSKIEFSNFLDKESIKLNKKN